MRVLIAFLLLVGVLVQPLPVRAADAHLDHASLKSLIEGLGYEPVEKSFSNTGDKYWDLSFPRGPWTYNVTINANNKDSIWTSVEFAVYKGEKQGIPPSALLGMLEENNRLVWSRFRYQESTRSFFLVSTLRNKNISPADLRRVIEEIVAAADRTQTLWDPKQWPKAAAAEPAKAVPQTAEETKK